MGVKGAAHAVVCLGPRLHSTLESGSWLIEQDIVAIRIPTPPHLYSMFIE